MTMGPDQISDMLSAGWIVLQLLAIIVFFSWLTCANDGWGLFLGLELTAVVLLFIAWFGLWVIGIDLNDHQWLTLALITWPLIAMLAFQLVNTYEKVRSNVYRDADALSNEPSIIPENVTKRAETQTMSPSVYKIVERAAFIGRRYALWNAEGFAREFQGIGDSIIRSAWSNALDKVKDYEVIEVSPRREITRFIGDSIVSEVVSKPEYENDEANFAYLMSEFDPSKLSPIEEDREREIRRLLALRYVIRSRGAALGDNNELLGCFVVPKTRNGGLDGD